MQLAMPLQLRLYLRLRLWLGIEFLGRGPALLPTPIALQIVLAALALLLSNQLLPRRLFIRVLASAFFRVRHVHVLRPMWKI
jgi:hypothetical protein